MIVAGHSNECQISASMFIQYNHTLILYHTGIERQCSHDLCCKVSRLTLKAEVWMWNLKQKNDYLRNPSSLECTFYPCCAEVLLILGAYMKKQKMEECPAGQAESVEMRLTQAFTQLISLIDLLGLLNLWTSHLLTSCRSAGKKVQCDEVQVENNDGVDLTTCCCGQNLGAQRVIPGPLSPQNKSTFKIQSDILRNLRLRNRKGWFRCIPGL